MPTWGRGRPVTEICLTECEIESVENSLRKVVGEPCGEHQGSLASLSNFWGIQLAHREFRIIRQSERAAIVSDLDRPILECLYKYRSTEVQ